MVDQRTDDAGKSWGRPWCEAGRRAARKCMRQPPPPLRVVAPLCALFVSSRIQRLRNGVSASCGSWNGAGRQRRGPQVKPSCEIAEITWRVPARVCEIAWLKKQFGRPFATRRSILRVLALRQQMFTRHCTPIL